MSTGFAKPRYGASSFYKNFRLQTDKSGGTTHNVYRILPPMKSNAESGKWAVFHGTHFGYRGTDKNDPTKTKIRTFRCIEDTDRRTGMLKQNCPECDKIAEIKAQKDQTEAAAKTEGRSKEEIEYLLSGDNAWLRDHNCDRKHHLAVMNPGGEFGVLVISHKLKKQLDAEIDQLLKKRRIDPLDLKTGVWFDFIRTGRSIGELQDKVEVVKEVVNVGGRELEDIKPAPLTDEQIETALGVLPDLNNTVTVLSFDQITTLVQGGSEPDTVDAVFEMSTPHVREQTPPKRTPAPTVSNTTTATKPAVVDKPAATQPTPVTKPTAAVTPKGPTPAELIAKKKAELEAQLKALEASAAEPEVTPTPEEVGDTSTMSDDEFMARFGVDAR